MSHKHISIDCRNKIEVLHKEGYSARKIEKILGYHHSSISRELKRIPDNYKALDANSNYLEKSKNKGRKRKLTLGLKNYIEEKLMQSWSPEQIVGRSFQKILSYKTIYNWIYKGFLDVPLQVLRRKGKYLKAQERRGKFIIGTSISKRPKIVK